MRKLWFSFVRITSLRAPKWHADQPTQLSLRTFSLFYGLLFRVICPSDLYDRIVVHCVVPRICDFVVPGLPRSDSRKLCAADGQAADSRPSRSSKPAVRFAVDGCMLAGDRTATRTIDQRRCLSVRRQRRSTVRGQWQLDQSVTIAQLVNQAVYRADSYT